MGVMQQRGNMILLLTLQPYRLEQSFWRSSQTRRYVHHGVALCHSSSSSCSSHSSSYCSTAGTVQPCRQGLSKSASHACVYGLAATSISSI
jgi:hypothetical protein